MANDQKGLRILAKPKEYQVLTVDTRNGRMSKIQIDFTYMDEKTGQEVMARANEWLTKANLEDGCCFDRLAQIGYDEKVHGLDDFKEQKVKLTDACWIDIRIKKKGLYVYRNAQIVIVRDEELEDGYVEDEVVSLFDSFADKRLKEKEEKKRAHETPAPDDEQQPY